MRPWIIWIIVFLVVCVGFVGIARADGLSARINAAQIAEGDSFQLVLSVDGQASAAPDLSPLSKDFDVLGTSQSSQTQIINGRRSQSLSWIVTLSPRSKGALTIPSLSAGALTSEPLTVNVLDASQLPKSQGVGGITVSASIDEGSHYVFQEIPLTVRVETALPLQQASLIAPTGDFELTQTGQDRSSQVNRNGQLLSVVERSYLLRPQSEGALTIAPFTLRGSVRDPNTRRDPFADMGFGSSMMQDMFGQSPFGSMMSGSPFDSMFNRGKPFVARSDSLSLDVLANPNATGSDWFLPAKAVEIQGNWEPANPTFREGEAVTRRISLLALGARPEQLPDLTFAEPNGARIYLDDTETKTVETEQGTVARRDFLLSIVPTHGGEITLPEVSVEWLDTTDDQSKTATLEALTITVEGTLPAVAPTPIKPVADSVSASESDGIAIWAGGIALALGLLVALILGGYRLAKIVSLKPSEVSTVRRELQAATKSGDHKAFYQALLKYRSHAGQNKQGPVSEALAELESFAFSNDATKTQPDLQNLLKLVLKQNGKSAASWIKGEAKLPPLYPSQSH